VIRDLLGKNVVRKGDEVTLEGAFPVKGDLIATGFTTLPWREKVLLYSAPTQAGVAAPASYCAMRVPSNWRNCAIQSGCAGQAGAVTRLPSVTAAVMAMSAYLPCPSSTSGRQAG